MVTDRLDVCAIDTAGQLWHTVRSPFQGGKWRAFSDVQEQTSPFGPNIGPTPQAACSAAALDSGLHVCAVDAAGGLWHTMRHGVPPGWLAFGDVQGQTSLVGHSIGPTSQVACTTDPARALHVCAVDAAGGLWHTMRRADGVWLAFGDIQGQTSLAGPNIGSISQVACVADPAAALHVCAVDAAGGLWHTMRRADGVWLAFGDVQGQTSLVGPGIGSVSWVACAGGATKASGGLHVCAVDAGGGLWHTMRLADGAWLAFGDVQGQTSLIGPNVGPTPQAACSNHRQGPLHVCAVDGGGRLWHTIRREDGVWLAFGDVQAAASAP